MKTRKLSGFLAFFMVLLSCQQGTWMKVQHVFPKDNWIRFEDQWFDFNPPNQQSEADIRLILTYTEQVELDRLPVMGTIHTPSGEMRYRELMFHFRDAKGNMKGTAVEGKGKWKGETLWQQELVMRQQFVFREDGLYSFEIENLSSKYDNPGIRSLELRVEAR